VVELINAYSRALVGTGEDTVESLLIDWDTPGLNLETDSVVVHLPDGRMVATVELWDIQEDHTRMHGYWRVLPEFEGRGIEERLLAWMEERGRHSLALSSPEVQVTLVISFLDLDRTAARVLTEGGWRQVRQLARMVAELDSPKDIPVEVPSGIRLEQWSDRFHEAALFALYESFRDHWGVVPETFETYRQRIGHLFDQPGVKAELSWVALEGDEVVGAEICRSDSPDDATMGWVNLLGVRRPWRKRGVGEALLRGAFTQFRGLGRKRVGLNVDLGSLTGATRLYEKVGMRVTRRYLAYEKVLREGIDLTVRTITPD
jgi:GNAT superfamily N-acetyltransferase